MLKKLGQQLISAFSNGAQGGNPSYVIATSGSWSQCEQEYISIASERACEVTHIHFDGKLGKAQVRFYVSAGAIAFCGHGALAAGAWAVAAWRATDSLFLDYGSGLLKMYINSDGTLGFIEQVGACRELPINQTLREYITDMLGLKVLPELTRIWLGGRQRTKALILLPDREWLAQLHIQPDLRDQFCRQHEVTGIYNFAIEQRGYLAARHFPYASTAEDMATGNIAATVAALVCGTNPHQLNIRQGGARCTESSLYLQPHTEDCWFVSGRYRIGNQ